LEPLTISDTDKKALDDLELQAPTPERAYVPGGGASVGQGDGTTESGVANVAQGG
jgi:cytochrome c oxidase cbb3-type subunit I/II